MVVAAAAQSPAGGAKAGVGAFTVDIPVLVLDKHGQPVLQLDQDLFRLSDNLRPQRIARFETAARPVSLAIVVDAHDRDALAQAKRSAVLMASMVMGAEGEASVYVAGAQPGQVLGFTADADKVEETLQHLPLSPAAPLGQGTVTQPANQAVVDLSHRAADRTRAVLIIARQADRDGTDAHALEEAAMSQSVTIFRISPEKLDNTAEAQNPDSVEVGGTGQGSQRDPNVMPNGANRGAPNYNNKDQATVDLTPVLRTGAKVAGAVVTPHYLDYVFDSGGLTLGSGDNAEFDRQLSSIGADLRALYHLYFRPDDLSAPSRRHRVEVRVLRGAETPPVGKIEYRRGYFGPVQ